MQKYKIQEKKLIPVDKEKLKYAWWIYLRNLLGVSTITGAFLFKLADLERKKFLIFTVKYENISKVFIRNFENSEETVFQLRYHPSWFG